MNPIGDSSLVLALAPMQGLVDPRMRELLTSIGGIDYCVSEFIRVSSTAVEPHVIVRECPELLTQARTRSGAAVHVQLLGSDCEAMAETAKRCALLGAQVIDLNFGCPVKRVNSHDGGAALLRYPDRIERIARAVRHAVDPSVAVSAKVRTGWESSERVGEIVAAVQAAGCAWVTVHGRTKAQAYEGRADWSAIRRAREAVTIPVVANGDISSVQDLQRCREETGCERFMIGRGAIVHPDLFARIRGLRSEPMGVGEKLELLRRFLRMMKDSGVQKDLMMVGRMKGFCLSMAKADPEVNEVFTQMKRSSTVQQVEACLGGKV